MNFQQQATEDVEFVRAFQRGETRAFDKLVARYQRQVANLIYLSLGDKNSIEDLTQEVFLRVYRALPRFQFDASFFSWIYRITKNLCIDEIRKRKIKKVFSLDFLIEGMESRELNVTTGETPSDEFLSGEKKQTILQALQKIKFEHREILLLREYQDFSYEEIAETLKISLQAVKSRLFRAREELRTHLQPYFKERT